MTANAEAAMPPDQSRIPRHRLVPREKIYADCRAKYGTDEVADYLLAVRDEVERCPDIGGVDTWSRLERRLGRAAGKRNQRRKALSRHFTLESKGPPWQTAMLVVRHVVTPDRREEVQARFAELYQAARGERPPTGHPSTSVGQADGPVDRARRKKPDEAQVTGDPASVIADMQQLLTDLLEEVAAARKDVGQRRARLPRPRDGQLRSGQPAGVPQQQNLPITPIGWPDVAIRRIDWCFLDVDESPEVPRQRLLLSASVVLNSLHGGQGCRESSLLRNYNVNP